jgi:hypothetical protein
MQGMRQRWIGGLFLTGSLLSFASWGWAQNDMGEVVAAEGTAQRTPPPGGEPLGLGALVALLNQLQARSESKLGVLLDIGPTFVLKGEVAITIAEKTLNGAVLDLAQGTLRAVTFGSAIQIRTSSGGVITARSGFIVSCGAPPADICGPVRTRAPNTCLFIGVYGSAQVQAVGVMAPLDPQLCTYVEPGRPPDPLPPERLSLSDFQDLLDQTTIVGTGAEKDRLTVLPVLGRPPNIVDNIPDNPIELYKPLPLPPAPPSP